MITELWNGWAFGRIGELVYALELLLGAITAVMGCIGVVLCLRGANGRIETAFIEREYSARDDQPLNSPSSQSSLVTIRVEPGYLCLFRRRLCVVTIRQELEDTCEINREVWYAKDDG